MKPYELVLVIKAALSVDEKTAILNSVEEILEKKHIKQKDDIGVLKAAYFLQDKKDNTHIHLVSYHLELDPKKVNEFTKQFSFVKWLLRHFFYALDTNEEFITYADMQKKLEKILPEGKKKAIVSK